MTECSRMGLASRFIEQQHRTRGKTRRTQDDAIATDVLCTRIIIIIVSFRSQSSSHQGLYPLSVHNLFERSSSTAVVVLGVILFSQQHRPHSIPISYLYRCYTVYFSFSGRFNQTKIGREGETEFKESIEKCKLYFWAFLAYDYGPCFITNVSLCMVYSSYIVRRTKCKLNVAYLKYATRWN